MPIRAPMEVRQSSSLCASPNRRRMQAPTVFGEVTGRRMHHPTPRHKYDVAGLIDHLVEAGRRAAALGRGRTPPPGDEPPHVELSQASGQLHRAAEEAEQAWGG